MPFELRNGRTSLFRSFTYLLKENGYELARKQHKELPDHTPNKQMKVKTVCMFSFGILFLTTGLFSYFTRSYHELSFLIVLGAYTLYS